MAGREQAVFDRPRGGPILGYIWGSGYLRRQVLPPPGGGGRYFPFWGQNPEMYPYGLQSPKMPKMAQNHPNMVILAPDAMFWPFL